jgi:hypothetical protein
MQQEKQARAWQQDMQEKVGTDTLPRYKYSKPPQKENMKTGNGKAIFILPSFRGSGMKETPRGDNGYVVFKLMLLYTVHRTNVENEKKIFPEKELRGHRPNFNIHLSVSDLYIPLCLFCYRKYVDRSL